MCPTFTNCLDVRRTDLNYEQLRQLFASGAGRAQFWGDYYHPLTTFSIADDVWMAWQFNQPELGEGLVRLFVARPATLSSLSVPAPRFAADAKYVVNDLDNNATKQMIGRELMENGLEVFIRQATPGMCLSPYRKIK